jgi:hypothetical protein
MDAGKTVMIFDLKGTLIIEHPWPKPGTKYVATDALAGQPPKPSNRQRCPDAQTPGMS